MEREGRPEGKVIRTALWLTANWVALSTRTVKAMRRERRGRGKRERSQERSNIADPIRGNGAVREE